MPEIKVQHVVSCSSEDLTHKADNLLKSETYRKWKCSTAGEKQASIILQFEKASVIHSIDVGNEGSAFVEILVGHSTANNPDDFQVIVVTSSFMSPVESKNGTNTNRVRMFGPDKLSKAVTNKKWDRVKIVCSQPFNKHNTYGLSFIKFHAPPLPGEETSPPKAEGSSKLGHFKLKDDSQGSITPGSYFKNREKEKEAQPLTGAAAVRAASTLAATSMTTSVTTSQAKPARRSPSPARTKQPTQKRRLTDESSERNEREKAGGGGGSRKGEEREQPAKQPPIKKRKSEAEAPKQSVPFKKLMERVTFVLSGFQNPFRAELRDKAVEMGAKYKPDWGQGCTHLICAFANTPKYNQVRGKGKIVTKQWILDSHRKKTLMPWKRYELHSGESSSSEYDSETDEEDWEPAKQKTPVKKTATKPIQSETKASPSPGKGKPGSHLKGKSPIKKAAPKDDDDDYGGSTEGESDEDKPQVTKATRRQVRDDDVSSGGDTEDELRRIQGKPAKDDDYSGTTDEETSDKENGKNKNNNAIPELPDFFSGKKFFIYGSFDKEEKRQVKRFIIAFGGNLEDYMKDSVQYVITNSTWDDNFDQALTENASLAFVRPKWLYTCNEKSKFVPYQPYVVVPK